MHVRAPGAASAPTSAHAGAPADVPGLVRAIVARGGHASLRSPRDALTGVRLIESRGELRPGEVVTLVAPIAEAVATAHRLGWAHGAVGLDAICVDARGMPLLVAWESARELPGGASVAHDSAARGSPPRPRARTPVRADRRGAAAPRSRARRRRGEDWLIGDIDALTDLIRALAPSDRTSTVELERLLATAASADTSNGADSLVDALYDWSVPEAIDADHGGPALASECGGAGGVGHGARPSRADAFAGGVETSVRDPTPLRRRGGRAESWAGRFARGARRRPMLAAGAAVCALVAAGVVSVEMLTHDSGGGDAPAASNTAPDVDAGPGDTGPSPPVAADVPGGAEHSAPAEAQRPAGVDEPTQGAIDIVAARNDCLSRRDTTCVAGLFAPEAPGTEIDLAVLEHPAPPQKIAPDTCTVVDVNGHVALAQCLDEMGATMAVTIEWIADRWYLREVRSEAQEG